MEKKKIISYEDLDVYQRAYAACLRVAKEIIPYLPPNEQYDLKDQLSRASKSVPRLISEGFARKHQRSGFQKYLIDGIGESNECGVCIAQARDIYPHLTNIKAANELITEYKITASQLYKLQERWTEFNSMPKRTNQQP
jgi:four helix bundle protein